MSNEGLLHSLKQGFKQLRNTEITVIKQDVIQIAVQNQIKDSLSDVIKENLKTKALFCLCNFCITLMDYSFEPINSN